MKLTDFNYELPPNRIAQTPLERRDESRLMVVDKETCEIEHTRFNKIGEFLPKNSLMVLNDTKVIPARLMGNKSITGGKIELLLIQEQEKNTWEVLAKPRRSLKIGTELIFGEGILLAKVLDLLDNGHCLVDFSYDGDFFTILAQVGVIPLPPYIRRQATEDDRVRYQSVYATSEGAIAAPTAGLHFTTNLLDEIKSKGVDMAKLTLHVGIGTFQPVKVENVETHKMHEEYINLSSVEAQRIQMARENGKKIIAIGTTVVRALESASDSCTVNRYDGYSDLFIYPGYKFKVVDVLLTNFHLPKSTLLMLVSAFAKTTLIQKAYEEALKHQYRFYSYGDAMLII
ncbi:tRNA preQ1(34) S-adenosylmethionine ribosyltransferase-isomerase QueA [Candidatus Poribacteria bacterium]|nr:tRNA preQ1(34) S-adenosylmethionine ribosyltransferase-isomerase QueA [Candidatus Poribacteria bacterium]